MPTCARWKAERQADGTDHESSAQRRQARRRIQDRPSGKAGRQRIRRSPDNGSKTDPAETLQGHPRPQQRAWPALCRAAQDRRRLSGDRPAHGRRHVPGALAEGRREPCADHQGAARAVVRSGVALAEHRSPHPVQRAGRARHRAGQTGQAVQERALDRESLLRLREAILPADVAPSSSHPCATSRASIRTPIKRRSSTPASSSVRSRPPISSPTNPVVLDATLESRGENLLRGLRNLLEDMRRGGGRLSLRMADPAAFKFGENIASSPGQGRVPERADPAHPVRAVDPDGASPAVADRPALDQQVLHPGPQAEELVDQMVRRPGSHGVRDLLGQSRPRARRQGVLRLSARRPAGGARCDRAARPARREVNVVGYCIGGTLVASTLAYLAATNDKRIAVRDVVHDAARFCRRRRHLGLHRRGAARARRRAHAPHRLSRRPSHGRRVQPACARTT